MRKPKKIKFVAAHSFIQLGTSGIGHSYAFRPDAKTLFINGFAQKGEAAAVALLQQL